MGKKSIGRKYFSGVVNKFIFLSTLINTTVLSGQTGNIAFNEQGDRIESLYDIINIQNGQAIVVGSYRSNTVKIANH